MDALSDVLASLEIRGTFSSRLDARGAWALRFPNDPSQLKLGWVLEGSMGLQLGRRRAVRVDCGDVYLITSGEGFVAHSWPLEAEVADGVAAYRRSRQPDGVVRIGRGKLVSLLSGRFTLDADARALVMAPLPPLIRLSALDPRATPLSLLLRLIREEPVAGAPGTALAGSSLALLVLVQVLRLHLVTSRQATGWLGALRDERIGRAMAALHSEIARRWTVDELAALAAMSRTAFAVRFREVVGESPISYLARWRLAAARRLLQRSDATLAHIGAQVGYDSETSFNAAFRRAFGLPPGRYRSEVRARLAGEARGRPAAFAGPEHDLN